MPSLVPSHRQPIPRDLRLPASRHMSEDGTAEVADVWRILWHRRRWIAAAVAILTIGTLIYCVLTPSIYAAKVQILVDPRDVPAGASAASAGAIGPDGGITQAESQVSVIQSNSVLLRAIAATHLTSDPEFNRPSWLSGFKNLFDALLDRHPAKRAEAEERTLSALRRHLKVSRADKVLVVDAIVTAQAPDKAARLANAVADAYLAEQANARVRAARKLSDDVSAHLAEQRKRVEAAADAVERYKAAHNLVTATGQLVSEQQLAQVNRQLIDAQNRTAMLKARLDQIAHQRRAGTAADAIPEVMHSAVISQLRAQEATLVQRVADLEAQLGPRHPALTAARDQLRDVRRLISAELNRIAESAKTEYNSALASEQALSRELARLEKDTLAKDQAAVQLKALQRELDAVRGVYSTYLVKAQEARQQANIDNSTARVITRALPPLQRSWPPTLLLLCGAALTGVGVGAGLALLAESFKPTILSVAQVEALTDAPVVGILPAKSRESRRRYFSWLPERLRRLMPAEKSTAETSQQSATVADLALRRIFSARPSPERSYIRSLLVTSAIGDVDACNEVAKLVADAATEIGERVLMVDADLAGNQESSRAGLLDVLRGERAFDSVLYFEPSSNAALIAKGRRRGEAAGRGGQVFARRMLDDARQQFDLMVVNGGAAAENMKAAPLLAATDEVLLIARLNVTPRRDIAAAAEALSVMGCFVTAVLLIDSMAA